MAIGDLPPHQLAEMGHFSDVRGWQDRAQAEATPTDAHNRYHAGQG